MASRYTEGKGDMERTDSNIPVFNMEDIEEGAEGYDDERSLLMSQKSLEKRFGQSPVFIAATFMELGGLPPSTNPATLLKEAIHVISCGQRVKTGGLLSLGVEPVGLIGLQIGA